MSSIKFPPMRERLMNQDGSLTMPWYRFFESIKYFTDKTIDEVVSGKWQIKQYPPKTFTGANGTLTTEDFGKTIKFDMSNGDRTCYLPSVSSADIDGNFTIMRIGDGRLTILAADDDTIESSRQGSGIYCQERGRIIANVSIYLASETKWGIIGATGIWYVF